MNKHKIQNVINLAPKDRYGYLIRKVADFEQIFLIVDSDGLHVTIGNTEVKCIPVWPEIEFTELFLTDNWKEYKIKIIELNDFMEWLDQLETEGYLIAGFPNQDYNSVTVKPDEMKNHLIFECDQYE